MDIRELRRRLSLSQTQLAEQLGLHQTTISRLETGELTLDRRTMLALQALEAAAALAASPDAAAAA